MHGATWTEDGQGLYFDGQDDWVGIGEMNYDNITIETIIMYNDVNRSPMCILCNCESGGYGLLSVNKKNIYRVAASSPYKDVESINNVDVNTKYSLSGKHNQKEMTLFENGNKTSNSIQGKIEQTHDNTIMILGADPDGNKAVGSFFNGTIYSVRIYNRALTDEEVKNNYFIDQIRYNVALEKDAEGFTHYTAEELKQMGFTEIDQDAWINWDTREVKMEYEGQKYSSEKFNAQSNINDVQANTNFNLDIKYEDNRYKVTVAPEENEKNMQVAYRVKAESGKAENNWIIVNGFKFELGTYGTYEVKLSDGKGNQTIKTIKQTLETVKSDGEIAYLDGTLGEPLVNYKIYGKSVLEGASAETKSLGQTGSFNILITGRNILKGMSTPLEDTEYWDYGSHGQYIHPLNDGWANIERDNTNGTSYGWVNLYIRNKYKKMFKENQNYTLCYEVRNIKENGGEINLTTNHGNGTIGDGDDIFRKTIGNSKLSSREENKIYSFIDKTSIGDSFKNSAHCLRILADADAGQKIDFDLRFWIYEGEQTENLEYEPYDETIQKVAVGKPIAGESSGTKEQIEYGKSNLPKIETKKGATHILVEDETVGQTGGEYTYIKTEILN